MRPDEIVWKDREDKKTKFRISEILYLRVKKRKKKTVNKIEVLAIRAV